MQLIYEKIQGDALYQIYIDTEKEYFYIRAAGHIDEDFHTITNLRLIEEVEKYHYSRFIFDLSEQKSTHFRSRVWFISYVARKGYEILKGKTIYAAAISSFTASETGFTHTIIRSIASINSNINIQLFNINALEKAKDWILQEQKFVL